MTDTDRKEVEIKPCPFCGEQVKSTVCFNQKAAEHPMNDCRLKGMVFRLSEWNKRPQDNNLAPLDFQVIFDMLFDRTQYSVDSCKDIAEEICTKFGKDNSGMVIDKNSLADMLKDSAQYALGVHRISFFTPDIWPVGVRDFYLELYDQMMRKLSHQPPKEPVYDCGCGMGESCHALKKERKVSLEEIKNVS